MMDREMMKALRQDQAILEGITGKPMPLDFFGDDGLPADERTAANVALTAAIEALVEESKAGGGYLPAIATLLRIYADELADRFPDDVNGGRKA